MTRWCRRRRSGVQNIAEGSPGSGTSKKTELKLTNVARASRWRSCGLDYEDFLRQRGLLLWAREDRAGASWWRGGPKPPMRWRCG
jgi:hypothetical protein